ncbi:MAG: hypothetical protein HY294_05175 [Candidatus Rokubacteria bacterium]|nr:hypothetical protein [Candidatus Rokubacteria bacterium]MBI3825369.1 hypothetical protein [Candidatus Rokubacteria bacterium]
MAPRPTPAERRLLDLARALAERARPMADPREAWLATLGGLAAAHAGDGPLPSEIREAERRARDKTRRLALAWAREQVRLALAEVLERAAGAGAVRADVAPDVLAWLVLAGAEALSREAPEAAADHARALADFTLAGARSR